MRVERLNEESFLLVLVWFDINKTFQAHHKISMAKHFGTRSWVARKSNAKRNTNVNVLFLIYLKLRVYIYLFIYLSNV
jgi:hypothetical protein